MPRITMRCEGHFSPDTFSAEYAEVGTFCSGKLRFWYKAKLASEDARIHPYRLRFSVWDIKDYHEGGLAIIRLMLSRTREKLELRQQFTFNIVPAGSTFYFDSFFSTPHPDVSDLNDVRPILCKFFDLFEEACAL